MRRLQNAFRRNANSSTATHPRGTTTAQARGAAFGACLALAGVLGAAQPMLPSSALAQDINALMTDEPATTKDPEAGRTGTAPAVPGADANVPPGSLDQALDSVDRRSKALTVRPDAWVVSNEAIGHVNIIVARPLPDETCQNVIFDARPYLKERYEPNDGARIDLKMKSLCLMGLRNDSENRTLVVRLTENLETLAIAPDPQFFSGQEIAPGQQIMLALRPLPVAQLDIGLEVVWKDDLGKPNPPIGKATLTVAQ